MPCSQTWQPMGSLAPEASLFPLFLAGLSQLSPTQPFAGIPFFARLWSS